jgi:hypothetical protein
MKLLAFGLIMAMSIAQGAAPAPKAHEAIVAAYHALTSTEIEAHKVKAPPTEEMENIDVSEQVRSASFGHTTTLWVPKHQAHEGAVFYVHYGRSTNAPAATFGPFKVKAN